MNKVERKEIEEVKGAGERKWRDVGEGDEVQEDGRLGGKMPREVSIRAPANCGTILFEPLAIKKKRGHQKKVESRK